MTCVMPLAKLWIHRQTNGAAKPKSTARDISDASHMIGTSSRTCTFTSNVGNTLPLTLGLRHSISLSHVSFDTRRFIAIASSMLTKPLHLVLATPWHSSHSGHVAHSRSGGQCSSTSSTHQRMTGMLRAGAASMILLISPQGLWKVEMASMAPVILVPSDGQDEDSGTEVPQP